MSKTLSDSTLVSIAFVCVMQGYLGGDFTPEEIQTMLKVVKKWSPNLDEKKSEKIILKAHKDAEKFNDNPEITKKHTSNLRNNLDDNELKKLIQNLKEISEADKEYTDDEKNIIEYLTDLWGLDGDDTEEMEPITFDIDISELEEIVEEEDEQPTAGITGSIALPKGNILAQSLCNLYLVFAQTVTDGDENSKEVKDAIKYFSEWEVVFNKNELKTIINDCKKFTKNLLTQNTGMIIHYITKIACKSIVELGPFNQENLNTIILDLKDIALTSGGINRNEMLFINQVAKIIGSDVSIDENELEDQKGTTPKKSSAKKQSETSEDPIESFREYMFSKFHKVDMRNPKGKPYGSIKMPNKCVRSYHVRKDHIAIQFISQGGKDVKAFKKFFKANNFEYKGKKPELKEGIKNPNYISAEYKIPYKEKEDLFNDDIRYDAMVVLELMDDEFEAFAL